MLCPYCRQTHPDNAKFCPVTGQTLPQLQPAAQAACPNCGGSLPPGVVYCPKCGKDLRYKPKANPIAIIAAALVGLVLIGILGWIIWQRMGVEEAPVAQVASQQGSAEPAGAKRQEAGGEIQELQQGSPGEATDRAPASTSTPSHVDTAAPTEVPPSPTLTFTLQSTSTQGPTSTPLPSPTPLPLNGKDGAELVYIPAGEFLMGSDPGTDPYFYGARGPSHRVYLDEYWIYRTEVTNAMYQLCTEAKGCPLPAGFNSNTRKEYYGNPQYADYPVVNISHKNATAYCRWAGGRLPTEAEWEKAARGTDGRLFPWGNEPPQPNNANYGTVDTEPVAYYPDGASPYGVLDMAGNVIEWVFDYFQDTYYQVSPEENPLGPASGKTRVYRGGSYHNLEEALRVVMRGSRDASHAEC